MNASETIKNYIKSKEGLHRVREDGLIAAYLCPAKVWTIGWGTTKYRSGKAVAEGDVITPKQAQEYFDWDVSWFAGAVERLVQVPLTQEQFDALVSFVYNVGAGALEKSTLLKKLNQRDYKGAAKEFLRWNTANGKKLPGLTKRREYEKWLFESGSDYKIQPNPNNTPMKNRDLPLPTAMRDGYEVQPHTTTAQAVTVATGGAVGFGAAIEIAGQTTPLVHALSAVDWRVACFLLVVLVLSSVVWCLLKRR